MLAQSLCIERRLASADVFALFLFFAALPLSCFCLSCRLPLLFLRLLTLMLASLSLRSFLPSPKGVPIRGASFSALRIGTSLRTGVAIPILLRFFIAVWRLYRTASCSLCKKTI